MDELYVCRISPTVRNDELRNVLESAYGTVRCIQRHKTNRTRAFVRLASAKETARAIAEGALLAPSVCRDDSRYLLVERRSEGIIPHLAQVRLTGLPDGPHTPVFISSLRAFLSRFGPVHHIVLKASLALVSFVHNRDADALLATHKPLVWDALSLRVQRTSEYVAAADESSSATVEAMDALTIAPPPAPPLCATASRLTSWTTIVTPPPPASLLGVLQACGFEQYHQAMVDYGVDTVADLLLLEEDDWTVLGVKPFHRKKLLARVNK